MTTTVPLVGAIETRYAGVRFRSRLEARWAVFFDALGLAWEYEPEAYTDGSVMYLPDFWLPELELFWEVKPNETTARADIAKHRMLVQVTGCELFVVHRTPAEIAKFDSPDFDGQFCSDDTAEWGYCAEAHLSSGWLGCDSLGDVLNAIDEAAQIRFYEPGRGVADRAVSLVKPRPPKLNRERCTSDWMEHLAERWLKALTTRERRYVRECWGHKGDMLVEFWGDVPSWSNRILAERVAKGWLMRGFVPPWTSDADCYDHPAWADPDLPS